MLQHGASQNFLPAEVDQIKDLLAGRIDNLVSELFHGSAKKVGNQYRLGSLAGEAGMSLSISRDKGKEGLWHDHNPSGDGSGDIIDLIKRAKNFNFNEAIFWSLDWLGITQKTATTNKQSKPADKKKEANIEFLARRQKRLKDNKVALDWLYGRGLTDATIENFRLGLSEPYVDKDNVSHENALLAPVIDEKGLYTNQTVYHNIPSLTVNPTAKNGWMKGAPATYYSGKYTNQSAVFVCEGLKDLWRLWQALGERRGELDLLLITSTHGSAIPAEWKQPEFWNRFDLVFLGNDNDKAGVETAIKISSGAGHETLRVLPPKEKGKDWTDFWQAGGTFTEFKSLLAEASIISIEVSDAVDNKNKAGRFAYQPVDIATAFHRGFLYYPIKTISNVLETTRDFQGKEKTQLATRIETVIVRSDRTIHAVVEEPAPKGTASEDRVLRLTDGTLIDSQPKASSYSTWSWNSVQAYNNGQSKTRPISEMLAEVKAFLKQSIWLPYDYDYDLLTLLVPVTFAQAVFQSVPMVLVVGPPGSGKSALGGAMGKVSANAVVVGQISAAGIARLIHETKGFVVLDDLESVGNRAGRDAPQFNELIQALKLSYNKDTSWKIWTDVKRGMRVEKLNFFGVKMINNTSGADNILGSRMLRVQTRKIPKELQSAMGIKEEFDLPRLERLRDEFHTWTFSNVELVAQTYKRLFPHPTDRATEISAPLRVFAEIAGDAELTDGLTRALDTKSEVSTDLDDPIDVMKEAMTKLIREGFRELSTTHVVMEMRTLVDQNSSRETTTQILPWEDPAWVGRQLRNHDFIETNAAATRQFLFGKSLRIYPVKEHFLVEVLSENKTPADLLEKPPTSFCVGCECCRYRSASCPIMENRLAAEGKQQRRPAGNNNHKNH
jgi:hypothetical protein